MSKRRCWTIDISFYEGDVDPEKFFDAVERWVYENDPGFSGVIGMSSEIEDD